MLKDYLILTRLHAPVGFVLLFWPCAFGIALATPALHIDLLVIFFIGSILMRAVGCIINDVVDKDIDAKVKRTKNRPIANGRIPTKNALIFALLLSAIGAVILFSLNKIAICVGLISVPLIAIYPFAKQYTKYPQVILGAAFNLGVLISYAQVTGVIDNKATLLYLACILWTIGYDTIYATQDLECDNKLGIGSTALAFKCHLKKFVCLCFTLMLVILTCVSPPNSSIKATLFLAMVLHALWQAFTLDIGAQKDIAMRFKSNAIFGLLVYVYLSN